MVRRIFDDACGRQAVDERIIYNIHSEWKCFCSHRLSKAIIYPQIPPTKKK